jgi:Leucine-rich repeat (LRR) protein
LQICKSYDITFAIVKQLAIFSFTSIPEVVYNLAKLETLFASDNKIALIDIDKLLPMANLANLGLANNEITQVPPQLGLMKLK